MFVAATTSINEVVTASNAGVVVPHLTMMARNFKTSLIALSLALRFAAYGDFDIQIDATRSAYRCALSTP
ncbi:hypothetical protein O9992_28015 [Vibrio lentus]|nr:hypothetical protein [Vibrio lentus]